jgi:c-di-GMP-binding flagellar brake protein YcgR
MDAEDRTESQATGQRERRAQPRHELNEYAAIYFINTAAMMRGRILNLSLSGCGIETKERFPVGIYTRVEVGFSVDGLPFRLGGVIQAIHDRRHVGIRFLEMSERNRGRVAELIEDLEEMRAAGA